MTQRPLVSYRSVAILTLLGALMIPTWESGLSAQGHTLVAPDGSVDWNRYYTAGETEQILRELHDLYPELTELYAIGKSFQGRPLWVMEVTAEITGPASEKPALYLDGGIHAGELTGSQVALYTLGQLLTRYGWDPEVNDLLEGYAFYIRPKFNPDGSDLALIQDQVLRSTVRPWDEDEDGTADEDPPEDLDGDGWITNIRVPDPEGEWYAHPRDPRVLVRLEGRGGGPEGGQPTSRQAPAGAQRYRLIREGVDNDGDGLMNEDGFGGIDMNRNFPRNWEPEHLQSGAGPFPLSEPETYATVKFIQEHPNITSIVHGHTSGGFVYRLPSASAPSLFPQNDLALIEHLGEPYTQTTGRPVEPSATHPTRHRYGTLITWGYWDQGVVGWVPEYSPGPESWVRDYDGNGSVDPLEEMRFNEDELGGRYFSPWTRYPHPQLGEVEVGGWHSKFWGQNPPPEYLEEECAAQLPWILYLVKQAPRLALEGPSVTPLGDGTFRIRAVLTNQGFLPTSLTGRGAVGRETAEGTLSFPIVRPPVLTLSLEGAALVQGSSRVKLGHLKGSGPFLPEVGVAAETVEWIVRPEQSPAYIQVVARSDKAGVVRSAWIELR
ncbi:MAG: M14 family metallopeptidase [Longimicrobiales bacterium]